MSNMWKKKLTVLKMSKTFIMHNNNSGENLFKNWSKKLLSGKYPHSTVIFKEYFENIPLKSCNIAKIFIKLLERFLK